MKKYNYILVLVSIVFFSCKNEKKEPIASTNQDLIEVTKSQFESSAMEISNPSSQSFNIAVKATGRIDVPPLNRAKVATFMGGYVKTTTLLIGDNVKKGQALLTLENSDFIDIQKDYLEVAEQINYLKSEYERQKTLFKEEISSQKNFLKAESDYRRANAMYASLREKLVLLNINPVQVEKGKLTSTITLYAPISGTISVMNANVGMFMAPSNIILEIINNSDLHVELSVFEKDILKIKENQVIQFKVPEASKETFGANVHLVGKTIEGNDRTVNVHGHLDSNTKQELLAGMFVEADILVASKKSLAIPLEALIVENNKNFVLLLDNTVGNNYFFKKTTVSIGIKNEKWVEIIPSNTINQNSKILSKGTFEMTN